MRGAGRIVLLAPEVAHTAVAGRFGILLIITDGPRQSSGEVSGRLHLGCNKWFADREENGLIDV